MERSFRQKISKETLALNDTLEQTDLIDIYRAFQPKAEKYTLSKCTWDILQDRSYARPQNKPR